MHPIDITEAARTRRAHVRLLHVGLAATAAAVAALLAAHPLPADRPTAAAADVRADAPAIPPLDYLPARLPPPAGAPAPWIDTF